MIYVAIILAILHMPMTWILAGSITAAVLIEKVVYAPRPTTEKEDSN